MEGFVKVLAVDLLNPSTAAEGRKHKLKVSNPLDASTADDCLIDAGNACRLSYQLLDRSSWMSSALAASPSPLSSPTPRLSSSAKAARRFSASQRAARPDLPRAALSGESKRSRDCFRFFGIFGMVMGNIQASARLF